jgi:hypothetical protein
MILAANGWAQHLNIAFAANAFATAADLVERAGAAT